MSKIYTPNDFLRTIYNETSPAETAKIQHLFSNQLQAKEEYESLSEMVSMLDDAELDAHPTSIQIILEHAHKLAEQVL